MSFGPSLPEAHIKVGSYVDRIFKGYNLDCAQKCERCV
jgi:hypothetical protein